jgi:hypothetical protein
MSLTMASPTPRRIVWPVCFTLVFVSAFFLSGTTRPPLELDPSWHVALEYATEHHLQFGTQIVFTFGPLGFLSTRTSLGHLLGARLAFAFFWAALVALAATTLAKRLRGWVRYAFLAWLVIFTLSEGLDQTAFFVMAYGALLLIVDNRRQRWQSPALVLAFIVLSLIKFSFLIAALASLALVLVCWVRQRKIRNTIVLALAAPAGFVAGWIALGQSPSHLVLWLRHGLELASGYSAAMNLVPKPPVLWAALAALVLFTGAWVASAVRVRGGFLTWACRITLAQYVFFAWKEGLTRSGDWHTYVFLWFLPLGVAFLFLEELAGVPTPSHRGALEVTFAVSMLLCLVGSTLQISGFTWRQVTAWPTRVTHNGESIVAILGGRADDLYADCRHAQNDRMLLLERAKYVIGNQSVDVMNYLALAPIINGLNYRPRPIFQGFVAYTPALQNLNADYFRSAERPHFVMLRQQATDDRFPALEDSAAMNYVLNNYVPVARDGDFLILQQRTAEDPAFQLVHEQILHFGEKLDLTRWADAPLFMSVSIRPSLLGRAITFVYQPEPLFMGIARNGELERFRIVPSMATQPFLVNPLLNGTYDVLFFDISVRRPPTNSVVFEHPENGSFEFQDNLSVRLYTAPGFPHAAKGVSPYDMMADVQGRVFSLEPRPGIRNMCAMQTVMFHGAPAWLMCAPSKIVLDIPPNTSAFSAYFGVPGEIYPGEAATRESVNIAIDVCSKPGACRRASDQLLAPSSGVGDGERFSFRIPIDSSRDRYIELTTSPAPTAKTRNSLSVWSQGRFERTPSP